MSVKMESRRKQNEGGCWRQLFWKRAELGKQKSGQRGAAALLPSSMPSCPEGSHLGFCVSAVSSLTLPSGAAHTAHTGHPPRRMHDRRVGSGDEHKLEI